MIRTVVTGATGRMGSTLVRLLHDTPGFELVGATARQVAQLGLPAEVLVGDALEQVLRDGRAQVVIDFTGADASVAHARACAEAGVALVVGSTGFSPEAHAQV